MSWRAWIEDELISLWYSYCAINNRVLLYGYGCPLEIDDYLLLNWRFSLNCDQIVTVEAEIWTILVDPQELLFLAHVNKLIQRHFLFNVGQTQCQYIGWNWTSIHIWIPILNHLEYAERLIAVVVVQEISYFIVLQCDLLEEVLCYFGYGVCEILKRDLVHAAVIACCLNIVIDGSFLGILNLNFMAKFRLIYFFVVFVHQIIAVCFFHGAGQEERILARINFIFNHFSRLKESNAALSFP